MALNQLAPSSRTTKCNRLSYPLHRIRRTFAPIRSTLLNCLIQRILSLSLLDVDALAALYLSSLNDFWLYPLKSPSWAISILILLDVGIYGDPSTARLLSASQCSKEP